MDGKIQIKNIGKHLQHIQKNNLIMSKQVIFFATEEDKKDIASLLINFFGELLQTYSRIKSDFSPFEEQEKRKLFLIEKDKIDTLSFSYYENQDGTIDDFLEIYKNPIIEYLPADYNYKEGYYTEGRFYCCSEDKDFCNKVGKFFTKFKKQFLYSKKWGCYISKNIDIENTSFFIPNMIVKITKEDLSKKS